MKVDNLKITKINEVESGTSQAGKEWQKLTFVGETSEQYNNLYAFQLFGKEKVENFNKFNKVGDSVNVEFNVECREWKGKYFTNLSAWRIDKANGTPKESNDVANHNESEELPF